MTYDLLKFSSDNYQMKKIVAILLYLLAFIDSYSQEFKYPVITNTSESSSDFIPSGWKVLDSAKGDLNKDGKHDLAFILQHIDSIQIVKNENGYSETTITQPRILCVAFQEPEGQYKLVEQSNSFILNHNSPQMEDPYESLAISNGILQINFRLFYNMGSWYINQLSYKFRYQNDNFELIGADNNSLHRATMETEDRSYNFLTKKYSITKGKADDDVETNTTWHILKIKGLKNLKTFKQPMTWEVMESQFL